MFVIARTVVLAAALSMLVAATSPMHTAAATRASGGPPYTVADPAGDSGTAPDITGLDINADDSGQATFGVDVPIVATDTTSIVSVFIDADRNPATGDPNSFAADYEIDSYQADHTFSIEMWDSGSATWIEDPNYSTVSVNYDSTGVSFSINRSDLGGASKIGVFATSITSDTAYGPGQYDELPNTGTTLFDLSPMTLSVATFKSVWIKGATTQLVFALIAKRSDSGSYVSGTDGKLSCTATIAGKKIPVGTSGFVTAQQIAVGTCVWKLAKKYKGKTIRGTVTVTVGDRTISRSAFGKVP